MEHRWSPPNSFDLLDIINLVLVQIIFPVSCGSDAPGNDSVLHLLGDWAGRLLILSHSSIVDTIHRIKEAGVLEDRTIIQPGIPRNLYFNMSGLMSTSFPTVSLMWHLTPELPYNACTYLYFLGYPQLLTYLES